MQAKLHASNRWIGTLTGDDRASIVKRALSEARKQGLKHFTLTFTTSETIGCREALEYGRSIAD